MPISLTTLLAALCSIFRSRALELENLALRHQIGVLQRAIISLTHMWFSSIVFYMDAPNTLQEAIVYFSDPDRAFEYAKKLRWPDGKVVCPRCGKAKHSFIKTRRIWFCYECKKQFTLKLGTVFEDSPLGLDKWMTGFWLLVNCKNGVSSMEIHRALGITQKAAWFMLQRLRLAIQDDFYGSKLGGGGWRGRS